MEQDDPVILDDVYADRNLLAQLAAVLAQMAGLQVGIAPDPAEPGWPVVYINLPTGQVSWHIPSDELVSQLPSYQHSWDGHSSDEKQERVRRFLSAPANARRA